jgi:hypothetical protein
MRLDREAVKVKKGRRFHLVVSRSDQTLIADWRSQISRFDRGQFLIMATCGWISSGDTASD